MNGIAQTAPQSLRGRMYQRDNGKAKERRILVLKTGVAGLSYHIASDEERAALDALKPGTELMLFREPDNEYDEWAIAVHLTNEDKIGFISRFKNETIARLMDVGKRFIGVVDAPATDETAREIVERDQRRRRSAPTEDMSVPFSVYMIE